MLIKMFFDEEEFFPFNPLECQKRARVVVQGSIYFVEKIPKKKQLLFSPLLFNGNKRSVKNFYNTEKIFPFEVVEEEASYVPFKNLHPDQIKIEEDLGELLEDFSYKEELPSSVN